MKVTLQPLQVEDREQFILGNQEAFRYGATQEFGLRDEHFEEDGEIISRGTIAESIDSGTAYRILADGEIAGRLVIKVEGERGELELLFTAPALHSRGIGFAAWQAVERLQPEVRVWETCTPYFETRNIHFYVNRCGFHIVEFFCALLNRTRRRTRRMAAYLTVNLKIYYTILRKLLMTAAKKGGHSPMRAGLPL